MNYIKLFEKFIDIDDICYQYGVSDYTINEDGSIDVNGNVDLCDKKLTKLPLKFRNVNGDFDCQCNYLSTLEGGPIYVSGNYECDFNDLITLKGSPQLVGGKFDCTHNKLTSLENGPLTVEGDFNCYYNKLTTLKGGPEKINGIFSCSYNPMYKIYTVFNNYKKFKDSMDYDYIRGTDIVKSRFQEALDEFGLELPEEIEGYNYI